MNPKAVAKLVEALRHIVTVGTSATSNKHGLVYIAQSALEDWVTSGTIKCPVCASLNTQPMGHNHPSYRGWPNCKDCNAAWREECRKS